MTVHPLVHEIADAYLTLVDAAAPGLVEGLYVVGSAALGTSTRRGATSTSWLCPPIR